MCRARLPNERRQHGHTPLPTRVRSRRQIQMTRMAALVGSGGFDVELSLSRDDEAEPDTSQPYFLDLVRRIDGQRSHTAPENIGPA